MGQNVAFEVHPSVVVSPALCHSSSGPIYATPAATSSYQPIPPTAAQFGRQSTAVGTACSANCPIPRSVARTDFDRIHILERNSGSRSVGQPAQLSQR